MNADPASATEGTASARQWIALLGAMQGAFMAVLDIQITNASLGNILGSLGATWDEGAWISTSYLVAEIIVIPLSAWLASVFSTRRYLLASTALFLASSIACGWSWNLGSMIAFRAVQGFSGGVLIPIAFSLVLKLLPPARRGFGFAIFGMTATFAPAIGPTLGGWLTENFGWPSIFYINLVPGALLMAAIALCLDGEPMQLGRLRSGDWPGIITAAIGLGTLIVVLEEGNRLDWFNSRLIVLTGVVSVVSLTACVAIELTTRAPFVELRLLADRNFGVSAIISAAFGAGMYGMTYLLPLYLAQLQGYNALDIGRTIMWSGLPQLVMMPIAALLLRRFDARLLLTLGLVLFGGSSYLNACMTNLTAYDQLKWTQIVRAMGMPLVIVPLTTLATARLAPEQAGSGSALFNMLRNLGGSIGIALLTTQLDLREKLHSVRLGEHVTLFSAATAERLRGIEAFLTARGTNPVEASRKALEVMTLTVRKEAYVMAYADCFLILAAVIAAMLLLVWFCRGARGGVVGH